MMGQQTRTEWLSYYFRLEEQIPADHLLRMIDDHVNFSFVREQVKDFYSPPHGPALDRSRSSVAIVASRVSLWDHQQTVRGTESTIPAVKA